MDFPERCLQLCEYITTLSHVHTTLLHILTRAFLSPPFQGGCALEGSACTALRTHLFGAYEAQRWGGSYIYYCPRGLLFLAVLPHTPGAVAEYCAIIGPIIMENNSEDPFEDPLGHPCSLCGIPRMTTAEVRALCELALSAFTFLPVEAVPGQPDKDASLPMQVLYDYTVTVPHAGDYPIEQEHRLQEYIRSGSREAAQQLLNDLLSQLYASAGNDMRQIKPRIHELLVLMNRAAIDGGADIDEIFNLCCRYERELDTFYQTDALDRWLGMILHQFIGFVFDFNAIKHQNVIFKTTDYIKAHLSERISLDQAAAQVYLSKSYFCRILKSELGCTFTEYVNRLRIERSKQLLKRSAMSVAEIAFAVGFEDQSYFTRIFKKQVGISPGKFREKLR